MNKQCHYRWLAEWANEHGESCPWNDRLAAQSFPTTWDFESDDNCGATDPVMVEAVKYGCNKNCYGSECFVMLQEWGYDQHPFEDNGKSKNYSWWTLEKYLCCDGEVVERVD